MQAQTRKQALRRITNGVYVLTARGIDRRCGAAIVSWVSQASFKPPLIMAAVRRQSTVFGCLAEAGSAALHIVDERQGELARRFAATTDASGGEINGVPFSDSEATTAPLLHGPPACLDCSVDRIVDIGGDHAIVILRVVQAHCEGQFRPLTMADSPWEYGG